MISQIIAALSDALRQAGGEAQSAAGATADPLERLRRIRTRLDWIEAQVRGLEAELASLKRIADRRASAAPKH